MKIDRALLDKTAHLARLEFSEAETEKMLEDFQQMVSFVEKLNEVDTSDVEPLTTMTLEVNVLREDKVGEHMTTTDALKHAPKKDDAFFLVPKVVDHP